MNRIVSCILFTFLCLSQVQSLNNTTAPSSPTGSTAPTSFPTGSTPPSSPGSTPQEPRFCSLPSNATTFTCDVISYTDNVIHRGIPGLAIALFFLVVLTIFTCGLCCFRCCSKKRTSYELLKTRGCRLSLMAVPLFLLAVGAVLILIAHFQINPVLVYSVSLLDHGSESILKLNYDINVTLASIHSLYSNSPSSMPQVNLALQNVNTGLVFARTITNDAQIGRVALVAVAVSLAFLVGILGLGMCRTSHGFFYFCVLILAYILIIGSCIFIGVLAVMEPVLEDTCKEVDYKGNMFDLIESQSMTAFNDLQNSLMSEVNSTIAQICSAFQNLCQQKKELCGACNPITFSNFMNSTVTDQNGSKKTLLECNSTCVNSNLKELASDYVDAIYFRSLSSNLLSEVNNTVVNFFGPVPELKTNLCGTVNPINLLYAGCAFFLAGCAISGFFMLLISKNRPVEVVGGELDVDSLYQLTTA